MKILVPLTGKLTTTINANQSLDDAITISNTYGRPVKLRGYSFFYKNGLGSVQAQVKVTGLRLSTITDDDTPLAALGCELNRSSPISGMAMPFQDGPMLQENQKITAKLATAGTAANADEVFLVFIAELDN